MRMGRVRDAGDELRTASEADPLNGDIHYLRGVAAIARGDFDDAVHAWGRFLALAPTDVRAEPVRAALESVARLRAVVETAVHG